MSDASREENARLRARIRGAARRIIEEPGSALKDAGRVLDTVIDGSDRARSEIARLIGREVRTTLTQLGVMKLFEEMLTGYTLEVHASFSLQPKRNGRDDAAPDEPDDATEPEESP